MLESNTTHLDFDCESLTCGLKRGHEHESRYMQVDCDYVAHI